MKKAKAENPQGCLRPLLSLLLVAAGVMGATYYSLKAWSDNSIPTYIRGGQFTLNAWARDLNVLDFAFTDAGEVVWVHSYYASRGKGTASHSYQLDVIQPQPRKLIKKYYFTQTYSITASNEMSEFLPTGKYFVIGNNFFPLQFRDAATGEIKIDEQAFIQKHPELKAGIGEIAKLEEKGYILTTRDGVKYYYVVAQDLLLSPQEYEKSRNNDYQEEIDLKRKDRAILYGWALTDKLRGEVYLAKQYESSFQKLYPQPLASFDDKDAEIKKRQAALEKEEQELQERLTRIRSNEARDNMLKSFRDRQAREQNSTLRRQVLVAHIKNKTFLEGEIMYGDSTLCVVRHRSEIGKQGRVLLSVVHRDGKTTLLPDLRILEGVQDLSSYRFRAYRKGNRLALVSNHYERAGVILVDVEQGKVLWEYVPTDN